MYFLSPEEMKFLQRDLIPKARESGVADELRGWNWHDAPMHPPYDVTLALHEVAGKYCSTGRDVYMRRVQGQKSAPGTPMLAGAAYHGCVVQVMGEAKRLIYSYGPREMERIAEELRRFRPELPLDLSEAQALSLRPSLDKIRNFEVSRILGRISDILSQQPFIGPDSLVASAIPVTCEHRLNGSFLGLSSLLSCDAASLGGTMVYDLKFGRKRDFHRLTATGYALVMESLWDLPVDFGCIVYVDLRGPVPAVTRDLFFIGDELRQWFIDERDDKMRIVSEELDPGVSAECYEYCEFREQCRK